MGKVFDMDEKTISENTMPGNNKCKYCNLILVSSARRRRHESDLTCVNSPRFLMMNKHHP
jgi:hypothetical protein